MIFINIFFGKLDKYNLPVYRILVKMTIKIKGTRFEILLTGDTGLRLIKS